MKYVHTNIIARDWKLLADFYIKVFECKPVLPERDIKGDWLEKGTGVKNASLRGIHLLLPGFDNDGPTLEIFQYHRNEKKSNPVANREGFGHLAFLVSSVDEILDKMISHGGTRLGEVVKKKLDYGIIVFTYAKDPEGNIIELQSWE
jgi:predicted enzyme related to lactoylglutathione lyase